MILLTIIITTILTIPTITAIIITTKEHPVIPIETHQVLLPLCGVALEAKVLREAQDLSAAQPAFRLGFRVYGFGFRV